MKRKDIVNNIFISLSEKDDKGLGQFRAILKSLIEWQTFDSYYFDDLEKLNREDAKSAIQHLKNLQESHDKKQKETINSRAQRVHREQIQNTYKLLNNLKESFFPYIKENYLHKSVVMSLKVFFRS